MLENVCVSKPEPGIYCLPGRDGPEAITHTHDDYFLIAFWKVSKTCKDALKHLVQTLHLKQQSDTVVCCGRTISKWQPHDSGSR